MESEALNAEGAEGPAPLDLGPIAAGGAVVKLKGLSVTFDNIVHEKPLSVVSSSAPSSALSSPQTWDDTATADGWDEVSDDEGGVPYYYHAATGATKWERPVKEVKKVKGAAKKGAAAAAPAAAAPKAEAPAPPASALSSATSGAKRVAMGAYNHPLSLLLRLGVGLWCVRQSMPKAKEFFDYSHQLAEGFSQPSIMVKARLNTGEEIMVDDYREAYWWLRDHTPKDARVMAWWDYGYQINGIAERTSIADGNTWNHEHIATLGRILSGSEEDSHKIARHLADYVLVWAGGGGDDLAKSPHMARIGNSVYHDICPGDPTCSQFGFYQGGHPTPMMEKCLLYRMVNYGQQGVKKLDPSRYTHAFTSKYGKVRIFKVRSVSKKSKDWVADPANKLCDAPGSWYCVGQYPPAIQWLIAKRKPFKQLEDFNVKGTEEDREYQEEYH